MHGTEGVGHIQIRHVGQLPGQLRVVLGLAGLKAGVLQQQDLSRLQGGRLGLGVGAHHVMGENHFPAQQLAEALRHRGQAQLGVWAVLGLAQVGAGDDRRPILQQIPDGGQRRHDALVAGDGAGLFVLGDVEVTAEQDLFAPHLHIPDRLFMGIHLRCPPI